MVGKLQRFALSVAPHVAPESIDDLGGTWLMFSSGQAVEFVSEFLWYLDDAGDRFREQVPRLVSCFGTLT